MGKASKDRLEVAQIRAEADRLAIEFKRLKQESQSAYQEGDHGRAKALSLEAKRRQAECEALNARVAAAYGAGESGVASGGQPALEAHARVPLLPTRLGRPALPATERVPESVEAYSEDIKAFLSRFPGWHTSAIAEVRVVSHGALGAACRRGTYSRATGRVTVALPPEQVNDVKGHVFASLTHEVGHGVFHALPHAVASEWESLAWRLCRDELVDISLERAYQRLGRDGLEAEFFARTYARHFLEPLRLAIAYPEVHEFVSRHIFKPTKT